MGHSKWPLIVCLSVLPDLATAGACDVAWDGYKIASSIASSTPSTFVPLHSKQFGTQPVSVGDIQAFSTAVSRITAVAGVSPKYLICNSEDPNAFAMQGKDGPVVGVTIGMLKLVHGDADMAAAVLGHELAHHTQHHAQLAETRDAIIGVIGLVAGAVLDAKLQRHQHTQPGLGFDLANLGSALVSRKFGRDQEREADEIGFKYLVSASFDPNGAIRLAERMNTAGWGGAGIFMDSHPGWPERTERFRGLLAADPRAQQLAKAGPTILASVRSESLPENVELLPTYTTTDAQRSYADGLVAMREKNFAKALQDIRSAGESGYAPAQATLGYLYLNGLAGLRRDEGEAVRLLRLAAEQGDPLGLTNLGFAYASGKGGLVRDDAEAVRLHKLAAEQGHPLAQANLGFFYSRGAGGLPHDDVEAVRLYKLSADQGNALGRANLAAMYLHGRGGLPKDEVEAVRLFKIAADQGNAGAFANLGYAYSRGLAGLPKDEGMAVYYYQRGGALGSALAQANLGYMYSTGKGGLRRDPKEAVRLYRLSADQGHPLGQNNLGAAYERGLGGVPLDRDEAIAWYRKAAAQGESHAIANLKRLGVTQ